MTGRATTSPPGLHCARPSRSLPFGDNTGKTSLRRSGGTGHGDGVSKRASGCRFWGTYGGRRPSKGAGSWAGGTECPSATIVSPPACPAPEGKGWGLHTGKMKVAEGGVGTPGRGALLQWCVELSLAAMWC